MDSKLNWNTHITQATHRGATAFAAASWITASTWGPSFRRTRLLYTAVVRPTMLYGAQIWGIGPSGNFLAKGSLAPLVKLQNQCLRRITGAYKRTPSAALEREAAVPPLDLYIDTVAMQRSVTVQGHSVEENIQQTLKCIQGARAPWRGTVHKHTNQETLCLWATERENEIWGYLEH